MTTFAVTAIQYAKLGAIFLHITKQQKTKKVAYSQRANAVDFEHAMSKTKYGWFLQSNSKTDVDNFEVYELATFVDYDDAKEYKRDSVEYYEKELGITVLNTVY
jgi:hypothetical protein